MKTRVRNLTAMNVRACTEAGLGSCGASTVEFPGGPAEALRTLRTTLEDATRGHLRASLQAVRRKLEVAVSVMPELERLAAGSTQLTAHVTVTKEASDGVVVVEI